MYPLSRPSFPPEHPSPWSVERRFLSIVGGKHERIIPRAGLEPPVARRAKLKGRLHPQHHPKRTSFSGGLPLLSNLRPRH
jgi:hypothetical protein